jgi:dihydrofolate synthase/folylpolyglutamate synthase
MPSVVEDAARAIGAPLKRIGVEYRYELEAAARAQTAAPAGAWRYRGSRWDLLHLPAPALGGDTQYANAATAIAALEEIDARLTITGLAVAQGITRMQLVARFQVIAPVNAAAPAWILDVAHNPGAARVLARNLRALPSGRPTGGRPTGAGRILAVFGILADKDAAGVIAELRDCVDAWWCVPTEGGRGLSSTALAEVVRQQVTVPVEAAQDTAAGCDAALAHAHPEDRIVVFGSFHTVGPALDWLEAHDVLPPAALP